MILYTLRMLIRLAVLFTIFNALMFRAALSECHESASPEESPGDAHVFCARRVSPVIPTGVDPDDGGF